MMEKIKNFNAKKKSHCEREPTEKIFKKQESAKTRPSRVQTVTPMSSTSLLHKKRVWKEKGGKGGQGTISSMTKSSIARQQQVKWLRRNSCG